MAKITMDEAERMGWTVDRHVYPHLAYTGPRFAPETFEHCYTETEAELLDAAENLLIAMGMGWDLDGVIEVTREAIAKARGRS